VSRLFLSAWLLALGGAGISAWAAADLARAPAASAPVAARRVLDGGDRYRTVEGERHLWRVEGDLVVTYEAGLAGSARARAGASMVAAGAREQAIRPEMVVWRAPREPGAKSDPARRAALAAEPGVRVCNPLFFDPVHQAEVAFTEEIMVRLREGVEAKSYFGADWPRVRPLFITGPEYILSVSRADAESILAEVNRHAADARVEWAEPNLLSEFRPDYQPNDPLFPDQWQHDHIGQNSTPTNGDIRTPQAWDITQGGSTNIVIAIVDDGVQWTHPDLQASIFINTGDNDSDGLDDDGNGVIDDVSGYNFASTNNASFPYEGFSDHGTSCAGMAAARGDNGVGVAGVAYRCRILPVKFADSNTWVGGASRAQAIRYAAGLDGAGNQVWRGADVISMSWVGTADAVGNSALAAAATSGRNGRGCVLFGSSGNNASGHEIYNLDMSGFAAGNYRIRFEYCKDAGGVFGLDAVRLGGIFMPDVSRSRVFFDSLALPVGWTTGGGAPFTIEDDPNFAYGTGRYQARAGVITNGQISWLQSPVFSLQPTNTLVFAAWVDTEAGTAAWSYPPPVGTEGDWLVLRVFEVATGIWSNYSVDAGVPGARRRVSGNAVSVASHWPSVHSNVVGVGGCTDMGYRYHGSQYLLTGLQFVAPTAGGVAGVRTTDRTGTNGYSTAVGVAGNYTDFSGTSAACPQAAGLAALLLSVNPNLTRTQVVQRMVVSCDPIGGLAYNNGTNLFFGYGRLNAYRALLSNAIPVSVVSSQDVVRNERVYTVGGTQTLRDGYQVEPVGRVDISGAGTIRLQPGFSALSGSVFRATLTP
jgi:subtilisin family serine protease